MQSMQVIIRVVSTLSRPFRVRSGSFNWLQRYEESAAKILTVVKVLRTCSNKLLACTSLRHPKGFANYQRLTANG